MTIVEDTAGNQHVSVFDGDSTAPVLSYTIPAKGPLWHWAQPDRTGEALVCLELLGREPAASRRSC